MSLSLSQSLFPCSLLSLSLHLGPESTFSLPPSALSFFPSYIKALGLSQQGVTHGLLHLEGGLGCWRQGIYLIVNLLNTEFLIQFILIPFMPCCRTIPDTLSIPTPKAPGSKWCRSPLLASVGPWWWPNWKLHTVTYGYIRRKWPRLHTGYIRSYIRSQILHTILHTGALFFTYGLHTRLHTQCEDLPCFFTSM